MTGMFHDPARRVENEAERTRRHAQTHGVVVGVDGSKRSLAAAVWALREATRRDLPLTLVSAYTLPIFPSVALDAGYGSMEDSALAEGAQQILAATVEQLGPTDVEIRTRVELGDPATVLTDYSSQAHLLVAGSRGRGGFMGLLVGSVSRSLPSNASCPVVLVPLGAEESRAGDNAPVVVGSDGGERGRLAILRAAEEARCRGADLRLVCAMAPVSSAVEWLPSTVDERALVDELQEKMDAGVAWLKAQVPDLNVTGEVIDGVPVDVMVAESEHARLTVVGTRGRGGFAGALLGSTSQGIIAHAKGPVMVVPFTKDKRLESRPEFGPMFDG
ncbi:universal stress protein [Citricoccus sp. NR2]|uniref:universal stress protein n=1 Tax=Citricoccus sp. NR2 TaxID=3004095 RepID=UPI002FD72D05